MAPPRARLVRLPILFAALLVAPLAMAPAAAALPADPAYDALDDATAGCYHENVGDARAWEAFAFQRATQPWPYDPFVIQPLAPIVWIPGVRGLEADALGRAAHTAALAADVEKATCLTDALGGGSPTVPDVVSLVWGLVCAPIGACEV